jgi:Flp pilus assembly protein TadD
LGLINPNNAVAVMLVTAIIAAVCLWYATRAPGDNLRNSEKLRRQAARHPRNGVARFQYAMSLYQRGKLVAAAHEFRECTLIDPKNAQAHHYLGTIMMMQGDAGSATMHFERATALSPLFAEAFASLGSAMELKGDIVAAEGAHLRAVALDPKLAIAHYNLARLYASLSDCTKAMKYLQNAVRLDRFYLQEAKSCADFDRIVHESAFQRLVYGRAA